MSPDAPDPALVRAELDRVLSNNRFARAQALSRLLRFIVTQTLEGGESLKEHSLGVEVFGRQVTYDPRIDPIVRVQVRLLRLKLADYYRTDGRADPIVIELPKGGYAATFHLAAALTSGVPEPRHRIRRLIAAAGGLGVLSLAGLGGLFLFSQVLRQPAASARSLSIAVLPLVVDAGQSDDRYVADGLTDEIASALRKVPGLHVVRPTTVGGPSGQPLGGIEIGRLLGVESVLQGQLRRDGAGIKLSVVMLAVADGRAVWSESFEGNHSTLFDFQVRIAGAVAAALAVRVEPDVQRRLQTRDVVDQEAHRLYMQARYFSNMRTRDGVEKSIALFKAAVERDPRYALAHAGLADAYCLGIWYIPLPAAEASVAARRAALTAVDLDPTLSEAHTALGAAYFADWQWTEAERSFDRAISLTPANSRAHHIRAYVLLITGRRDEAVAGIRRAQQLDPLSRVINADVAELLFHAGRYQDALAQADAMIKLDPDFPLTYWVLGHTYRRLNRDREALTAFLKEKQLKGRSPDALSTLENAYRRAGWPEYLKAELALEWQPIENIAPYCMGRQYAWIGDTDTAFKWLERAYEQHDVSLMNMPIDLQATLGRDARYDRLIAKLGLSN